MLGDGEVSEVAFKYMQMCIQWHRDVTCMLRHMHEDRIHTYTQWEEVPSVWVGSHDRWPLALSPK